MEFGRVTADQIGRINFNLPIDPSSNKLVLKGQRLPIEARLGTSRWGRKEWIGKLYPKGIKDKDFLPEYVKHFNCIFFNTTHYKIYERAEVKQWTDKVHDSHFLFCPKVTNSISHFSGFTDVGELTNQFIDGIKAFGEMLGPVTLQLSEKFTTKKREKLYTYLETWPSDIPLYFEVRHPDWFADKGVFNELLAILRKQHLGMIITDTAGRRDVLHMNLTIPKTIIRFVGNGVESDFSRINQWATRLKYWMDNGLEAFYFFVEMHDVAMVPELCKYTAERLNNVCGLALPPVDLQSS